MARCVFLLLVSVAMLAGCGRKSASAPKVTPAEQAKAALRDCAENGLVSSNVMEIKGYFEEIQKSDPAKGEALLKDLGDLLKIGQKDPAHGSAAAKSRAKALLGKL